MTAKEYFEKAQRTSSTDRPMQKMENGVMGLCGEAGECIDIWKKFKYQKHDLKREKLIEELGDVAWYLAESCAGLGITLEELFDRNIDKLEKRYPENRFTAARSVNRDI